MSAVSASTVDVNAKLSRFWLPVPKRELRVIVVKNFHVCLPEVLSKDIGLTVLIEEYGDK